MTTVKPWTPRTVFYTNERFQFKEVIYKVTETLVTGRTFDYDDGRYTIDLPSGRSIESMRINEDGDLIITYVDGTMQNAGATGGGSQPAESTLVSERLIVTATNVLSQLNNTVDTSKPIKLLVNHLYYSSIEIPSAVSGSGTTLTWNAANAGFDLNIDDSVVAEYSKIPA